MKPTALLEVVSTPAGTSIARLLIAALREQRESYRLTDATHSRSTAARKTRTDRAAEEARVTALAEALYEVERDIYRTPFEARMAMSAVIDQAEQS